MKRYAVGRGVRSVARASIMKALLQPMSYARRTGIRPRAGVRIELGAAGSARRTRATSVESPVVTVALEARDASPIDVLWPGIRTQFPGSPYASGRASSRLQRTPHGGRVEPRACDLRSEVGRKARVPIDLALIRGCRPSRARGGL